jgi:hypothetical protein
LADLDLAFFPFAIHDEAVRCYEGPLDLDGGPASGDGTIDFTLQPVPSLRFEFPTDVDVELGRHRLSLVARSAKPVALVTRCGETVEGIVQRVAIGERRRSLRRVVFQVANFHDVIVRSGPIETMELPAGDWHLTLRSHPGLHDAIGKLPTEGYAFTHAGVLSKADGSSFGGKDAATQLNGVQRVLSFARGFWCSPLLASGFTRGGDRVFEEWGTPRLDRWRPVESWFTRKRPESLQAVVHTFLRRWDDPFGRDVLRHVVAYWLTSNSTESLEVRIAMAQAGLELMAWVILVADPATKQLSPSAFRYSTSAEDKVERLLTRAKISRTIPRSLTALKRAAKKEGWSNGPQAITRLRNRVTHPRQKDGAFGPRGAVWIDTWMLTTWYLELVILHWIDYRDEYSNRLDRSRTEFDTKPVPWV